MRAILTYHSLDHSGSPISVSPAVFRAHVEFLAAGPVKVLSLQELLQAPETPDAVALTFDDGFANFATEAAPILAANGLRATIFAVSEHVGLTNRWGGVAARGIPELPLMTWDQLAQLRDAGHEVGAHTKTHPDLTLASSGQLDDEIAGSAERIATMTGSHPTSFAYPYGAVSDAAVEVARRAFSRAVTTELRMLISSDDLARLPRLDMYYFRDSGALETWGSAAFRRRLWWRAQGRRVRSFVAPARFGRRQQQGGTA